MKIVIICAITCGAWTCCWTEKTEHLSGLWIDGGSINRPFFDLPDGAVGTVGDVQDNRNGDGTLSPQGSHGLLGLELAAGGFDPGAAQVRQLAELNAVLLLRSLQRDRGRNS